MKVSLQLLGDAQSSFDVGKYNDSNIEELVNRIGSQLGAVDSWDNLGNVYKDCRIVKVVSCENHPNADKLHVCKIDDGHKTENIERDNDGLIQVVCGAPNVKEGLMVVWLPPGAVVPSSVNKDPFTLEAREIRGVISYGMLASPSELALSEDHNGILVLESDSEVGSSFAEQLSLNDYIIDIENKMFTHRPDAFGHLGIARELSGIYGQPFTSPEWYKQTPDSFKPESISLNIKVINEVPDLVSRFCVVGISGINIEPSPIWIQSFLSRIGIRPINNVVDLTNLFMVITGQPLHAYDYDKVLSLSGNNEAVLIARLPHEGEKITLLGNREVTPSSKTIMISTDKQAIGIGGVMGGMESEVDNQTKNIILECATFNMYSIRRTSMALGIFTEAVTRYTKGQSPLQNLAVLYKVAKEICDASGGKLASDVIDIKGEVVELQPITTSVSFINARLGSDFSSEKIAEVLTNVEFEVGMMDEQIMVKVPFWRTDIELPEDIVEEVGRLVGFDSLPSVLPTHSIMPISKDPSLTLKQIGRENLASMGANELLTYSFVHGDLLKKANQEFSEAYQLTNALSPTLQYYRTSLIPSLLEKIHPNIKAGYSEMALFEINPVHTKLHIDEKDKLPTEDMHLAFVFAADSKTAKSKYSGAPYYQAEKYLEGLMHSLNASIKIRPYDKDDKTADNFKASLAPFDPIRVAEISLVEGQVIGFIGEFRNSIRRNLKLSDFVAGFELNFSTLVGQNKQTSYKQIPKYPYIEQDICFRVDALVSYQDIVDLVQTNFKSDSGDTQLRSIEPVDIYKRPDEEDYKQITIRLSVINYQRTMTDAEVSKILDDLAMVAKDKLKAERV